MIDPINLLGSQQINTLFISSIYEQAPSKNSVQDMSVLWSPDDLGLTLLTVIDISLQNSNEIVSINRFYGHLSSHKRRNSGRTCNRTSHEI